MDLSQYPLKNLQALAEGLDVLSEEYRWHKINFMYPSQGTFSRDKYPKQMAFFKAGSKHRIKAIFGGNRSGKSMSMSCEITYHVTGQYPDWWEGKRFKNIKTIWIAAETGELWKESLQKLLFGEPGEPIGTGLIPLADKNNGVGIVSWGGLSGVSGGIGSAIVRHQNGQMVSIEVKTYKMPREQFQAAKVDLIAFDEEPPEHIWTECLMRLMGTGGKEPGCALFAFTPMKGRSKVASKFLIKGKLPADGFFPDQPEKYVTCVTWNDVPHLSESDKKMMVSEMDPREVKARTEGVPMAGAGLIYPIDEEFVVVQPFKIPDYWPRAYGLDFGWEKTAAVWVAKDPQTGTYYVYSEYYQGQTIPDLHVLNIKAKGIKIPGICDPSQGGRQANGKLLSDVYRSLGLDLTIGSNDAAYRAVLLNLFETGQLKIFSTVEHLLEELRTYSYDEKKPDQPAKDQDDHALDALKYLISMFDWVAKTEIDMTRRKLRKIKKRTGRDSLTGY